MKNKKLLTLAGASLWLLGVVIGVSVLADSGETTAVILAMAVVLAMAGAVAGAVLAGEAVAGGSTLGSAVVLSVVLTGAVIFATAGAVAGVALAMVGGALLGFGNACSSSS